jgi:hypothetical protein
MRKLRVVYAAVVVVGVAVGVFGHMTDRPFVEVCGTIAIPAAMLWVVATWPGWLDEARRK